MTQPHTKHPAKFSEPIIEQLRRIVDKEQKRLGRPMVVVDPFAGVGRIHRLASSNITTIGLEIEREWAGCHRDTIATDCRPWLRDRWNYLLPRPGLRIDAFVTSFCYGNRYSDHHEAQDGSERRSYRHDLGRMPTEGSAAVLPFGHEYKMFHAEVQRLMFWALAPGGLQVLNVSDIVRGRQLMPTTYWHEGAAMGAGFAPVPRSTMRVPTRRMRYGENHGHGAEPGQDTRAAFEIIYQFRRPHLHAV